MCNIHRFMYVCTCIRTYLCMYAYMHILYAYKYMSMHVRMHACDTFVCMFACICVHVCQADYAGKYTFCIIGTYT